MPKGAIPYPRQLQRNGLVMIGVGLVGTVVMALLHGGLEWSNIGPMIMIGGTVLVIVGRVLASRARTADEVARRR